MLADPTRDPRPRLSVRFTLAALAAGFFLHSAGAQGKTAIGGAAVIKNDVRSKADGQRRYRALATGGRVYRDDLVQTRNDSLAKIVFVDLTNMSVGPDSIVKMDRFVYNGDGTAKNVMIEATKGAFRFFSGKSPSKAYQVTTPQAVIGVRGTTYDVRITDGLTLVVLQDGEVNVCVRNTARCRVLDQPGQSVSVDDTDISPVLPPGSKPWDFASNCTGGASDLCNKTTQFALAPLPPRKATPKRRASRKKVRRPARTNKIRPVRRYDPPPRRRVVRRPVYEDMPIYDPPPRRVIIDEPIIVRPPRCYPGSRHPRCRIVRPRPCPGFWRRGRCIVRPPVVRPPHNPCQYSRGGCRIRPPEIRPPRHGRPHRPIYQRHPRRQGWTDRPRVFNGPGIRGGARGYIPRRGARTRFGGYRIRSRRGGTELR